MIRTVLIPNYKLAALHTIFNNSNSKIACYHTTQKQIYRIEFNRNKVSVQDKYRLSMTILGQFRVFLIDSFYDFAIFWFPSSGSNSTQQFVSEQECRYTDETKVPQRLEHG